MWIPKWLRDRRKGVDSPAPTQVVSNEEFIPRPQNREQKQVEYLVGELAAANSRKLGVKRRSFLRSSMGMAAYFWASNQVYGHHWEVEEAELWEPSDIEKAALDHPDLTFIIYHSAIKHGPSEPEFDSGSLFDPTTGRSHLAR